MTFTLSPLPFAQDALEPLMSQETLSYHHGKHHQGYVNKLNALLDAHPELQGQDLLTLIRTQEGAVFNNAAQVWNHDFFWQCLSPEVDQPMPEHLSAALTMHFGSPEEFQQAFLGAAAQHFGSGWTWLVADSQGTLRIVSTTNADTPVRNHDLHPLLTLDVWEHAYYLDTRNDRPRYLNQCWRLINWQGVADRLNA